MKRFLDIILSFLGILCLLPFGVILTALVVSGSKGPVFYKQQRVGRGNKDFGLLKFRSMKTGSDKKGLLTVGNTDSRITKTGGFLRKYKLDELPQLINVLLGEMSLVGPRPEVRKYVDMYSDEQLKVLSVRPGITDYASLEYIDEDAVLGAAEDAEKTYITTIMPAKLILNLKYVKEQNVWVDIKLILATLAKIAK
ncbi:MAG: lipopolysaccharide/colanic/teichoic acid biosynthesis glycosyltransferase [Saprospiraceae bacterium]|jgi:lipopolysaccharide/colanic/teichoic acid biosynthesis glycosyltransferase